jgi:hypothetical protein
MPRFMLCRIVMNVVAALMSTETRITPRMLQGVVPCKKVSASGTPKTLAFWALSTTARVSPYEGWTAACPGSGGFQLEIALSTLNSEMKTGNCASSGRQPESGLTPFSF